MHPNPSGSNLHPPIHQMEKDSTNTKSHTSSLLSTLQRHHRRNKTESSATAATVKPSKSEEKREKSSSGSPLKTFFHKIGSRGMLLYSSRQEVAVTVVTPENIISFDQKQRLVIKDNESSSMRKLPTIYHRHSLSSQSRSEFFTYIKCDDPTDGLSLDRKSPERGEDNNRLELPESPPREVKKASSLKRSHFPYSFLRSNKLGTLQEDTDKHQLIPNEMQEHHEHHNHVHQLDRNQGNCSGNVDVSRQNSITSLDYRTSTHRQLSNVRHLSRHLSSNESGYDSDSGRNVDSNLVPTKWSPTSTSDERDGSRDGAINNNSHNNGKTTTKQLVIKQRNESETVGIVVSRLKLLPNSGQVRWVVTGMLENGAAFR